MNDFFKRHLKEEMMPAYQPPRADSRSATRSDASLPIRFRRLQQHGCVIGFVCSSTTTACRRNDEQPASSCGDRERAACRLPKSPREARSARRSSQRAGSEEFHEGGRYCLKDEPSVVGEAINNHGWFCLKLTNGTCTQNIRYGEMREVGFERCQVPVGFMLVDGALLDGVPANITWYADDGEPPKPMFCRLRASQVAGTICADYFDDDKELLHIAIRPSDAACVAFDSHGAELQINPEDMCAPNSLMMDCARIESTAASLRGQPLFLGTGGSDGKGNVAALLSKARLTQYTEAALQHMKSDAFVESLAASVGMKPGHLARLKYYAGTESAQP